MKNTANLILLLILCQLSLAVLAQDTKLIRVTKSEEINDTITKGCVIYPDFEFVLQPEYQCYGEPIGEYRFLRCKFCRKPYVI